MIKTNTKIRKTNSFLPENSSTETLLGHLLKEAEGGATLVNLPTMQSFVCIRKTMHDKNINIDLTFNPKKKTANVKGSLNGNYTEISMYKAYRHTLETIRWAKTP